MLQSARFIELMDRLKTNFDWILIDAPPLQPSADVNYLSQQSDGILLVVREGNTPAKLLKKGLETLDSARVLGVVFNDTQILDRAYYEGYYCVDGALPAKG
jgi:Mrp family chromosome partitioning ATPase